MCKMLSNSFCADKTCFLLVTYKLGLLYLFNKKITILVWFSSYFMNGVRFRVNITRYLLLFFFLVELFCVFFLFSYGWTASLGHWLELFGHLLELLLDCYLVLNYSVASSV